MFFERTMHHRLRRYSERWRRPALGVRKGQHPKYDRLVFDWTRPVDYSLDRNGGSVSLNFNRPARVDIANVRSGLGRGFSNPSATAEGGRLRFSVSVGTNARIRHFRAGTKVVLDVFRDAKNEAPRQAVSPPPPQAAPVVPVKREAKAFDTTAPSQAPGVASPEIARDRVERNACRFIEARGSQATEASCIEVR